MVPLFIGDYFRRRRKPERANDEMPFDAMVDIVAFWMLLVFGGLLANIALFAAGAALLTGIQWDRTTIVLVTIAGLASPFCFWFAMIFWWRMTREGKSRR